MSTHKKRTEERIKQRAEERCEDVVIMSLEIHVSSVCGSGVVCCKTLVVFPILVLIFSF